MSGYIHAVARHLSPVAQSVDIGGLRTHKPWNREYGSVKAGKLLACLIDPTDTNYRRVYEVALNQAGNSASAAFNPTGARFSQGTEGRVTCVSFPSITTPGTEVRNETGNWYSDYSAVDFWIADPETAKVYRWDGKSLITDKTSAGTAVAAPFPGYVIAAFNEDLYLFGDHFCKQRAGGSWSTVSMPVAVTAFKPTCWVVHKNNLYIGGIDYISASDIEACILKYDGSTLTRVENFSVYTASGVYGSVDCLLSATDGYLYYSWHQPAASGALTACKIGRFDNSSTWDQGYADMTTEIGANVGALMTILETKGNMWCCTAGSPISDSGTPEGGKIYRTTSNVNPTGTWSLVATISGADSYEMVIP